MGIDQAALIEWFGAYAYQPMTVYSAIILLLVASSFGLPIPEEVTLISAGIMAYLVVHSDLIEPPYQGAKAVSVGGLMFVTFFAVFLSDLLVFFIGRYGGHKLQKNKRLERYLTSRAMVKAEKWTKQYGAIMCGVFRFTPGLRFPGHMMCGMLGVPIWKFIAVDGTAAILTVPTQVWAVATYGNYVLDHIKQIKIVLLIFIAIAIFIYFGRKLAIALRWLRA